MKSKDAKIVYDKFMGDLMKKECKTFEHFFSQKEFVKNCKEIKKIKDVCDELDQNILKLVNTATLQLQKQNKKNKKR